MQSFLEITPKFSQKDFLMKVFDLHYFHYESEMTTGRQLWFKKNKVFF